MQKFPVKGHCGKQKGNSQCHGTMGREGHVEGCIEVTNGRNAGSVKWGRKRESAGNVVKCKWGKKGRNNRKKKIQRTNREGLPAQGGVVEDTNCRWHVQNGEMQKSCV